MIDGKKETNDTSESISSSRSFAGILLIALFVSSGLYLYKHFDSQQGTVQILGQSLQLGESESNATEGQVPHHESEAEDD